MTTVNVTNFNVEVLKRIVPEKYKHLLPTTLIPEVVTFELEGNDINNAVANGLRRTIAGELPVKAMTCSIEINNFATTDEYVIPEMIRLRLKQIPLKQDCPINIKFDLNFTNNTPENINVKTGNMSITSGQLRRLPFNENITILILRPNQSINIKEIEVVSDFGYIPGSGMHVMAVQTSIEALDQEPLNVYNTPVTGIPSREADPHHYKVRFITNGVINAKELVKMACDSIIERAKLFKEAVTGAISDGNLYTIVIVNESHTIGNLVVKTISEIFPGIDFVSYAPHLTILNAIRITIRTDEDIGIVCNDTAAHIEKVMTRIKRIIG